jgi:pimeloyl-ACP methyl ester carboxylesterase
MAASLRRCAAVRSHHSALRGGRVHWVGAGRGEPIVLLHGLGNNCLVWRRVIPTLAASHRVIAPDLPGFGHSDPARRGPQLVAYIETVTALIEEQAGGRPVVLVGNSVGGAVALRVALDHPELVDRLVLVDPAGVGRGLPEWWQLIRAEPLVRLLASPALTLAPRSVIRDVVGRAYRHMAFADPAAVTDYTVRMLANRLDSREKLMRFLAIARDVVSSLEDEVQAREHELGCPVLVVWGREDRLVPLHDALALLERIEHAELQIIDRAGHLPHLERPREFIAALEGFVHGVGGTPRGRRHAGLSLARARARPAPARLAAAR